MKNEAMEHDPTPDSRSDKAASPRPKETSRRVGRGAGKWLFYLLIIAPIVIGAFLALRYGEFKKLTIKTETMVIPVVQVVRPQAGPAQTEVSLPGNLTAYSEASIYARTNGYLKAWYTDLGAKVQAGQLLAEISAPDVDAQLNQSTANLSQMVANQDIAKLNYDRQKDLLAKAVSSQQEFDQNRASFESAAAGVKAAQANVQNLTVQQNFQKIIAPFAGTVTMRSVDIGDLVQSAADTSANEAKALFRVARTDILRVFVSVPQAYSPYVTTGTQAYLTLVEYPGEKFEGHVTNISGALDPTTRTLLTEVQVSNENGRLFPGAYAQVHLILPVKKSLVVPSNTLIFRGNGVQLGVVGEDGIVHLKNVKLGQDFGTTIEVVEGITADDQIITNPSDSLADGAKVEIKKAKAS